MTNILKKLFLTLCALVTLASPLAVAAATLDDYYKQRDYYSSQAEIARQKAEEKAKEAEQLKKQISSVSNEITNTEKALVTTTGQIGQTETAIGQLEKEIADKEDSLAREREKMSRIIASWYMEGESGLLEALVGADSLTAIIDEQQYYDSIRQQVETAIDSLETAKNELSVEKNAKDQKLNELSSLKSTQENQKQYLAQKKVMKDRLLTDTKSAVTELKEEESAWVAKEQNILSEISRIISANKKRWLAEKGKGQKVSAGDVIGSMGSTGNSTGPHLHFEVRNEQDQTVNPRNYLGGLFIWPTISNRVTQEYGVTAFSSSSSFYRNSFHTGLDIGALEPGVSGDPIFAAGSGELVFKQWYGGYGYAVVVLHNNNMTTLYGHLASAK